jgi:hypothetical protein
MTELNRDDCRNRGASGNISQEKLTITQEYDRVAQPIIWKG